MKIIEKKLDIKPAYHFKDIKHENIVFFDIETTGLSADTSVLYLIGIVYYEENEWKFVQYFANDSEDEAKMIKAFFEVMSNRRYLVSFNGNGFDIPYMKKKIKQLKLDYSFSNIESIDLYKICRKYKDILQLDNCKLKTIEEYLGIYREDKYTGKDLIKVYKEYIKMYSLERITNNIDKSNELLEDLLLHNEEDIVDLLAVTKICYFEDVFKGNLVYEKYSCEEDSITLVYASDYIIPVKDNEGIKVENKKENVCIEIFRDKVVVKTDIYQEEMKYYYPDYKNYYYLVKEDTAIHKSVAQYVDKEYRQPAKPSNCYIKKESKFVKGIEDMGLPIFKKDYNDKNMYVELKEVERKYIKDYGKILIRNI